MIIEPDDEVVSVLIKDSGWHAVSHESFAWYRHWWWPWRTRFVFIENGRCYKGPASSVAMLQFAPEFDCPGCAEKLSGTTSNN